MVVGDFGACWLAGVELGVGAGVVACVGELDGLPLSVSTGEVVEPELDTPATDEVGSSLAPPAFPMLVGTGEASPAADGGSTTWLSTTETPAQATPTAAALAASHIENNISFFMDPVLQAANRERVNATLNEP